MSEFVRLRTTARTHGNKIYPRSVPDFARNFNLISDHVNVKLHLIKNLCKPGNSQQNLGEQGPFNGSTVLN